MPNTPATPIDLVRLDALDAFLLELNQAVAQREKAGQPVTAPGVPPSYGDPTPLISEDCITP